MSEFSRRNQERTNLFLTAVRSVDQTRVMDGLESIEVASGEVLVKANEPISRVYFPISCIISQIVPLESQKNVEVDTIGCEGFVGLPVALDSQQSLQCLVQIPGEAFCLEAELFREALDTNRHLRRLTNHYVLAKLTQFSRSVACNAIHEVRQRMCRWLLTCHDRVREDTFSITQKFLSQMLGVRRPTVSAVAASLQLDGLITYKRGRLTIENREGLEKTACSCYGVIKSEYDRLLG